ncbi:MAG: sugar ABC transporter permease [Clostridiales bacterium]|nr:sugar ABC transporter permease [Clostridiales bacterium]
MGGNKAINFLRKYMMLIATVIVAIAFNFITDGKTLIPMNIDSLISQNAYVFVLGTGMLLCILTGGNIDLSVGSVICLAGCVGAIIMDKNIPWPIAVAVMLFIGLLVGIWHGFWIAYIKVPPFIATLVGMLAFRGLANIILKGKDVSVENKSFLNFFGGSDSCYIPDFLANIGKPIVIGDTTLNKTCMVIAILFAVGIILYTFLNRARLLSKGYKVDNIAAVIIKTLIIVAVIIWFGYKLASYKGIPTAFVWIALVLGIFAYITTKTTLGRNLYAVGGNEKATRLSGIDTRKVMFSAYTLMGVLAGLAGILVIARGQKAGPTIGTGFEMDAIAACFIGGASAYGGTGSIGGVIIGAALMGIINQGMSIADTPVNYQKVVKGIVLIVAVLFDVIMQMRRKGAKKKASNVEASQKGGAKA